GASLTLQKSVIQNCSRYGILFEPNTPSKISITDTQFSDNNFAVYIGPGGSGTTTGVLERVHVDNSTNDGVTLASPTQDLNLAIIDSVIVSNGGDGIVAIGNNTGSVIGWLRNSTVAYNTNFGVQTNGAAGMILTRSTITGNGTGLDTENSQIRTISSYTDNNILLNGNDGVGTLLQNYK